MPAKFTVREGMDYVDRTVSESAADVANEVNACLSANLKFATFTDADTGKQFSVKASAVSKIQDI